MRFLIDVVMTAIALWLVTLIVPGVEVMGGVGAFIWVALVFMFVNAFISPVVNLISIPLKIVTLGLFSLLVNTLLFSIVGWISDGLGSGLQLSGFWAAFVGAIVMAIARWIVEAAFKATGLSGDKATT